jgi:uncharacterized membrane protein YfcA
MVPENFKVIGAVLIVLIVIYMIMRRRAEKIRKDRNARSRFRRDS